MTRRTQYLIAGSVAVMVLVAAIIHWRDPESQARACFANISQAIADGSANGVLSQIHHDYDITGHWPALDDELGGSATDPRAQASRALFGLFFLHRDDPLSLSVDIQSVVIQPNGQAVVTATLHLDSASGRLPVQLSTMHRLNWTLAREGWFAFHIIDHDPISLQR
jgi:hypothetical protein